MFEEDNDLKSYFLNNSGNFIHKWEHYFPIYDAHFRRFRGKRPTVLEIGCFHGGSLQMWRNYFGPGARIIGVDIDPRCARLEDDQIEIFVGDQADPEFLAHLRAQIPRIDILIDDGGHEMRQQIRTFEGLFSHIAEDGLYLCEDLHTSYWPEFGGGYRNSDSFIEFSKRLIDLLNAYHALDNTELRVDDFTLSAHSMHYYDSVLAIEKRPRSRPPRILRSGSFVEALLDPPIGDAPS